MDGLVQRAGAGLCVVVVHKLHQCAVLFSQRSGRNVVKVYGVEIVVFHSAIANSALAVALHNCSDLQRTVGAVDFDGGLEGTSSAIPPPIAAAPSPPTALMVPPVIITLTVLS